MRPGRILRISFLPGFLLFLAAPFHLPGADRAGEAGEREGSAGIWKDGLGRGFRADTLEAGLSFGAGFGVLAFGGTEFHDLALGSGRLGWVFSEASSGGWPLGNWEVLGEGFGGVQWSPRGRHVVGITPMIRHDFITRSPWLPFLGGGVGLCETDIRKPDLGTRFEFNVQAGVGTHYFLSERQALTFDYRWLHVSNAGIKSPNLGSNTQMFMVGLSWFF